MAGFKVITEAEKYSDIGNLFGCPQPLYWSCGYNCVENLLG
ncbi:MAG: hypothetical protein WBM14_07690 [Terracidiphilus sp.]|jgi:hypothetical protein